MKQPVRVVLPDADKEVAVHFYPEDRHVEVEWDDHYIDVTFDGAGCLVASSGYSHEVEIGHDPVGEVARLASISRPLAELIVCQFLELSATR